MPDPDNGWEFSWAGVLSLIGAVVLFFVLPFFIFLWWLSH
jgi:hypothetical protein